MYNDMFKYKTSAARTIRESITPNENNKWPFENDSNFKGDVNLCILNNVTPGRFINIIILFLEWFLSDRKSEIVL